MKEKRDCKLVQDLLPNYIDGLTNEETNKFIEEHLNTCEECRKMLENMQKEIDVTDNKREEKEVNYIKKYNIRLTSFKVISIIFLLIVLIFVISIERKMVILTSLMNSKQEIDTSNCYYTKKMFNGDEMSMMFQEYSKDGIFLGKCKLYYWEENIYTEQIDYCNNEIEQFSIGKYWDKEKQTISKDKIYPNPTATTGKITIKLSLINMENLKEYFDYAINSKITNIKYNEKDCYLITKEGTEIIIEKSTGFIFKTINKEANVVSYSNYSLGTVTDADIQKPDIAGYKKYDL